ncbi:MAG: ATP-binding protein [Bacteroidia bacterium]|nr:ATP-binding protein [Bacteroidia bacterium]
MIFVRLWNKISHLGVTDEISDFDRRRVILLNRSTAAILLIPLFYVFSFYTPEAPWSSGAVLFADLIILAGLIANYRRKYILAKWIGMLGFTLYINILIILHGKGLGGNITYLVLGLYGFIYFPKRRDKAIIFSVIILSLIGTEYFVQNYESPYASLVNYTVYISALLGNFLAVMILIGFIDYDQNNYVKDSGKLLEELQHKNQELETKNRKIATQNQKLLNLNNELQDFAYATSHHFKTPLRTIHSFMGLLEKQLDSQTLAQVEDYLNYAKDSSVHLYELTRNLLAFSKLSVSEGEKTAVDLNEILATVKNNMSKDIEDKGVEIEAEKLPILWGYPFHFELLLQNILDNGIKYNESNSPKIELSFENQGAWGVILISDNGIGIPEKYQQQIFDMFSRLHNSERYEGTGLGLSICRKIMEQYDGSLLLNSKEGIGTTFTLRFPASILTAEKALQRDHQI